jgi:methionyl-tRNA formyltransferase
LRFFFFGSGEFSGDILKTLIENKLIPQAVITRVDRPGGRGRRLRPTPVKLLAEESGLKVMQPRNIKEDSFLDTLNAAKPEVILLADYGELLPPALLQLPPGGCVNVHPSLLPRYRGASPVQRALMDGEDITGVTLMLMERGLDMGPIIYQEELEIGEEDDAGSLARKLAVLGGLLLVSRLPAYLSGEITPHPQDENEASYAEPINKRELLIDWSRKARTVFNQVRALSPSPGAYTYLHNKRLKILRAMPAAAGGKSPPGTIVVQEKDHLLVKAGEGALKLESLQPEGKKIMSAGEFLRGYHPKPGERFATISREDPGT